METLEKLRQRMDTARDLQSVVKTMKGLSAVSIRAFETASHAVGQYAVTVELGLQILLRNYPEITINRRLQKSSGSLTGVIVLGSEQGLCGSFNRLIAEHANREFDLANECLLATAGARVSDMLTKDHGHVLTDQLRMPVTVDGITDCVNDTLSLVIRWLDGNQVRRVELVRNRLVTASHYTPDSSVLFPFDQERIEAIRDQPWNSNCSPTFFVPPNKLLKKLIREHLFIGIYRAYAESLAAEHFARLSAMQAAEKNIEERLAKLSQNFHQLRQATVTEELLDVVSGFEALNKP